MNSGAGASSNVDAYKNRIPNMDWNDEYALGIHEIDNHHRALPTFIAGFQQAVEGKP